MFFVQSHIDSVYVLFNPSSLNFKKSFFLKKMNQKSHYFRYFFFSVGFCSCYLEACKTNNFGTVKLLKKDVKEKN